MEWTRENEGKSFEVKRLAVHVCVIERGGMGERERDHRLCSLLVLIPFASGGSVSPWQLSFRLVGAWGEGR